MEAELSEHIANVLKALAHPVRLNIIEALKDNEMCVNDIVVAVGGKQSITSQQLNMMKDRGVLACRKDGAKVFYRINNKNVLKLLGCMYEHCEN